jgi:oligoendopeptidase F
MPKYRWSFLIVLVVVIMVCASGKAFTQNSARQPGISVDLPKLFFTTPAAEVAARAELFAALQKLEQTKGQINSATSLFNALRMRDEVAETLAKHEAYLHLRCSLNRKDAACDDREKLESEVNAKTAFLDPEILSIPEDKLSAFWKQESGLNSYRFAIAEIRRESAYLLPAAERALLDKFEPEIGDWQYDLYGQIVAAAGFGSVSAKSGQLDVVRQAGLIASDANASVREEGFTRRYAGFARQRDLLAFSLIHIVRAQNSLAKTHHYVDAPERKYFSLYRSSEEARDLLERMAKDGEVVKRYEKIRSAEVEREYRQPAHAWDMSAPTPGFNPPLTSLENARSIFHEAFAGLGHDYQAAFDALLDPSTERADILPGGSAERYGGGFSVGFPGTTSVLFVGRYDGTFKSLSVIAHEGGHATHRQLMNANHVAASYAHGPNFLFESFAAFNELVLADYMAAHSDQPELKRYYLERWMGIKGLDAFYGADDALLEQSIYDGVAAGTVRNADDLDNLTAKVDSQFSIFVNSTPELRGRWATVGLMYEDPLYDVNYAYGGLLALKYYQLYSTKHDWFVPRYVAMLKNGFDAPPAELLKRFLEIDMSNSQLLEDDLALLNSRLDLLEK